MCKLSDYYGAKAAEVIRATMAELEKQIGKEEAFLTWIRVIPAHTREGRTNGVEQIDEGSGTITLRPETVEEAYRRQSELRSGELWCGKKDLPGAIADALSLEAHLMLNNLISDESQFDADNVWMLTRNESPLVSVAGALLKVEFCYIEMVLAGLKSKKEWNLREILRSMVRKVRV